MPQSMNQKFEDLLDLEFEARDAHASVKLQKAGALHGAPSLLQLVRAAENADNALFAAVAALTLEEAAEYRTYRLEVLVRYARKGLV